MMTTKNGSSFDTKMLPKEQEIVEFNKTMMNNLLHLRKDKCFIDIMLKCGCQTFPAHKVILASHSPYFMAMFNAGMKESEENIVEIQGEDPSALLRILEYMYSSELDESVDTNSLLGAAELLQVEIVSLKCCQHLLRTLTPTRFLDIWKTLDMYSKPDAVRQVVEYLALNFDTVRNMEEFWQMSLDQMLRVLERSKVQVSSESILIAILNWLKYDFLEREEYLSQLLPFVVFNAVPTALLINLIENESIVMRSNYLSQKITASLSIKLWKRNKVIALFRIVSPLELEVSCLNPKEKTQIFKAPIKLDNPLPTVLGICSNKNSVFMVTCSGVFTYNLEMRLWNRYPGLLEPSSQIGYKVGVSVDSVYFIEGQTMKRFLLTASDHTWQPVTSMPYDPGVFTVLDVDSTLHVISLMFLVQRYDSLADTWEAEDKHDLCTSSSCVLNHILSDQMLYASRLGDRIFLLLHDDENASPFTIYLTNTKLKVLRNKALPAVEFGSTVKCFDVTVSAGKHAIHVLDELGNWWSLEETANVWLQNGSYVGVPPVRVAGPHQCQTWFHPVDVSVWEYDSVNGIWYREISLTGPNNSAVLYNQQGNGIGNPVWNSGLSKVDFGVVAEMHID